MRLPHLITCFLISLILIILWFKFLFPYKPIAYDSLRDIGITLNILNNNYFNDSAIPEFKAWYPPFFHLVIAFFSSILQSDPLKVFIWVPLLFLLLLPYAAYYFSCGILSSQRAIIFALLILFSFPLIAMVIVLPIPFTAGLLWLFLAGGFLFNHPEFRKKEAFFFAILVAVGIYLHTLISFTLIAGIFFEMIIRFIKDRQNFHRQSLLLFATLAGLASGIPLYNLIFKTHFNPAPMRYFDQHLLELKAHLLDERGYVWLLAIFGGLWVYKQKNLAGRILMWFITLSFFMAVHPLFQILSGFELWWLVPHEFLILFQLGAGILIAEGIYRFAYFVASRFFILNRFIIASIFILLFLPLTFHFPSSIVQKTWRTDDFDPEWREMRSWILKNSDIMDVFLANKKVSYLFVNGQTGRKVVAMNETHINPSVPIFKRELDQRALLITNEEQLFIQMAAKYRIKFILLTKNEYCSNLEKWGGWSCFQKIPIGGQNWILLKFASPLT